MKLDTLLRTIEARPELFVGNDGIRGLRHFLCGYIMSEKEHLPTYQDWLFSDFTVFLSEKYKDCRSLDWASLIEENEADCNLIERFFSLIHEFKSTSNV
ncbi:hypothetical protein [uncultured Dysosmobacter sp.]|uniref:hypothetical protein n=1 Tax=uncultured Dysosmobacter sp. TaxID=2591384 RepID=UPI002616F768|nr:hypothetical protein [uncultured Dysosmobacter sp.]